MTNHITDRQTQADRHTDTHKFRYVPVIENYRNIHRSTCTVLVYSTYAFSLVKSNSHLQVMLRLVGVLETAHSGTAPVPLRVLMHAAAAMVNVTELDADEVPREQLDTHLPRFMHALEQLIASSLPKARASILQYYRSNLSHSFTSTVSCSQVNDRQHRALLEQLMTTLASLAECAGQSFKPYYPTCVGSRLDLDLLILF